LLKFWIRGPRPEGCLTPENEKILSGGFGFMGGSFFSENGATRLPSFSRAETQTSWNEMGPRPKGGGKRGHQETPCDTFTFLGFGAC
jgi:hypothetical protein